MPHPDSRVSVILPVLNAGDTIKECVESLLSQSIPPTDYSIIVVDNGSRDDTLNLLRQFDRRITIATESVRGPAAARNLGILSSDEPIIAFIDADCVATHTWLENLLTAFDDPDVGMAGGRILTAPDANDIQRYGERIHDHESAIEDSRPPYVISMNSAVRRRILAEVGLFDVEFRRGEDVDLSWRIGRAGYRFRYVENAVIQHRNESTLTGLLSEGALHGYYGVRIKRCHDAYLAELHRKRNRFGHLNRTWAGLRRYARRTGRDKNDLYDAVFNLGKTVGSLAGSLRFGYFEI